LAQASSDEVGHRLTQRRAPVPGDAASRIVQVGRVSHDDICESLRLFGKEIIGAGVGA